MRRQITGDLKGDGRGSIHGGVGGWENRRSLARQRTQGAEESLMASRLNKAAGIFEKEVSRLNDQISELQEKYEKEHDIACNKTLEVQQLRDRLADMDLKVAIASMRPTLDLINRLKAIEDRGNVAVSIETGVVEILKDINFVPRTRQQKPTAQFAEIEIVNPILHDIAEIAYMCSVPVEVQGHTAGSSCNFSRELSQKRAELIVEHLGARGVEKRLMSAVGMPGEKGLNKACVVIKLDIFPQKKKDETVDVQSKDDDSKHDGNAAAALTAVRALGALGKQATQDATDE